MNYNCHIRQKPVDTHSIDFTSQLKDQWRKKKVKLKKSEKSEIARKYGNNRGWIENFTVYTEKTKNEFKNTSFEPYITVALLCPKKV